MISECGKHDEDSAFTESFTESFTERALSMDRPWIGHGSGDSSLGSRVMNGIGLVHDIHLERLERLEEARDEDGLTTGLTKTEHFRRSFIPTSNHEYEYGVLS